MVHSRPRSQWSSLGTDADRRFSPAVCHHRIAEEAWQFTDDEIGRDERLSFGPELTNCLRVQQPDTGLQGAAQCC